MQSATDKLYEIASLISGGETFPSAIAIALDSPELQNIFERFESFFGNAIIELLTGFANVAEGLGADVSGIRDTVADLGERQLAFDLQFATDTEDVESAIQTALNRGVDAADLGPAINTAVSDALAEGDFGLAEKLVASAKEAAPQMLAEFDFTSASGVTETFKIPLQNIDMTLPQDQIQAQASEQIKAYLTSIGQEGLIASLPGLDVKLTEVSVDTTEAETKLEEYRTTVTEGITGIGTFIQNTLATAKLQEETLGYIDAAAAAGDYAEAVRLAKEANLTEEATYWQQFVDDASLAAEKQQEIADGATEVAENNEAVVQELEKLGETNPLIAAMADKWREVQGALELADMAVRNNIREGLTPMEGALEEVTYATDELNVTTTEWREGLQGEVEIAKVTWQTYADFLASLVLTPNVDGTLPPGTGGGPNFAVGTTNVPRDMMANIHAGEAILPPRVNDALFSLLSFYGMGGAGAGGGVVNNYNNIVLNTNQVNNNASQRYSGDMAIANQLRGMFS